MSLSAGAVPDGLDLWAPAGRLTTVEGVVGVALGGRRGRGDHTPDSDMHLGIYDQRDSDITPLREVARDVAGPGLGRSTRRAPSPRPAACPARSLTSPNPVTALSGRLGTTPAELAHSLQSAPELLDQVTTTCDRETT